jgi:ankyrin repeat protein
MLEKKPTTNPQNPEDVSDCQKRNGTAESMQAAEACVKLLLAKNATVDVQNDEGVTALHVAAGFGYTKVVIQLLLKNANVNHASKKEVTPLMLAATHGHLDIVKILVQRGANMNTVDEMGDTALMKATRNGHAAIVEFLLGKGADARVKNQSELCAWQMVPEGPEYEAIGLALCKAALPDGFEEWMNTLD